MGAQQMHQQSASDIPNNYTFNAQQGYSSSNEQANNQLVISSVPSGHSYIGLIKCRTKQGTVLQGTAFVIASNILLTSASNLWDTTNNCIGDSIRFYTGTEGHLQDQKYYSVQQSAKKTVVYIPPEFQKDPSISQCNYAFVKLSEQVTHTAHAELGINLRSGSHGVTLSGLRVIQDNKPVPAFSIFGSRKHESGTREETVKDGQVSISLNHHERNTKIVKHSLANYTHQSGSPISLTERKNCVIGLHTILGENNSSSYARMITIDLVVSLALWRQKYNASYFSVYDLTDNSPVKLGRQSLYAPIQSFVLSQNLVRERYDASQMAAERLKRILQQKKQEFTDKVRQLQSQKLKEQQQAGKKLQQLQQALSLKNKEIEELNKTHSNSLLAIAVSQNREELKEKVQFLMEQKKHMDYRFKQEIQHLQAQIDEQQIQIDELTSVNQDNEAQSQSEKKPTESGLARNRSIKQVQLIKEKQQQEQLKDAISKYYKKYREDHQLKTEAYRQELRAKRNLKIQLEQELARLRIPTKVFHQGPQAYQRMALEWDLRTPYAGRFDVRGLKAKLRKTGTRAYQITSKHPLSSSSSTTFNIHRYGGNSCIIMGVATEYRKERHSSGDEDEVQSVGLCTCTKDQLGSIWVNGENQVDEDQTLFIPPNTEVRMHVSFTQMLVEFSCQLWIKGRTFRLPQVFKSKKVYVFVTMNCKGDCVEAFDR